MAALESFKADLVVLDIMMRNLEGWELCRGIRKQCDIPLLILTAKGDKLDNSLNEVEITADEKLMSQVWLNLINNGIKFTPSGDSLKIVLYKHG